MRIVATIEVKNAFNVVFTADFTVHLNKGIKANSSDWTEYILHGRKIYFKKISYDEDE